MVKYENEIKIMSLAFNVEIYLSVVYDGQTADNILYVLLQMRNI